MKNRLLLLAFSMLSLMVTAQDQPDSYDLTRKNVIKVLPINYALNSYSFEFERMINAKNAFEIGLGIPSSQALTDKYSFVDWSEEEEFSNDKIEIFSLRAAYRHYTGKSMLPKGFYLAPILKYQNVNASASLTQTETFEGETETIRSDYDVRINTFSAGLQLGYQFLIAKRVTFDLFFFGLEAGLGSADATAKSDDFDQVTEMEADIEDAIDELPSFIGDKIDVTTTNNSVNIKGSSLPYPWFRGGFSIGIAF